MGGGTMHVDLHLPIIHDLRRSSSSSSYRENKDNNTNNLATVSSWSHLQAIKPSCSASYCFCEGESCRKLEVLLDGKEDKIKRRASGSGSGSFLSSDFGPAPSHFEVQNAIAALLNFMQRGITSSQSEIQCLQPVLNFCVPMLSYGKRRVYDAFQLFQTDPCVKRLVVSLSSDKALWDAVTNNELVRKLQQPLVIGDENEGLPQESNKEAEEPELAKRIVRWIMDITFAKIMELHETFQSLLKEIFIPPETKRENHTAADKDEFEEKVRSSLLLSVVILLIVVVTRFHQD